MDQDTLTYNQNMSRRETLHFMSAVALPLGAFGLSMFVVAAFDNFGSKLLCPLIAACWITGLFVATLLPSMRKEVLSQTMIFLFSYGGALLGFKVLLQLTSGVSADMIAASYQTAIPTATGNAIPGYVQTLMLFTSVFSPIGYIGMQGKRLLQFRRKQALTKTFGRIRSVRNNRNENLY